ncbi:MAG: asparagine synthase C-terminal domain-containing protein, partial [Candidatus Staskawiczbacteria bacterium]|nr:asparagine synthase C-terminal domain-containing protein [Candidatus Staskawiczbacteria bacterium]
ILENLEKVVWHMDDLVANPTQVSIYLLSRLAKKQVSVILGGDGGDELFGGYDRYYYYNLIEKWQKIPQVLRQNLVSHFFFKLMNKEKIYQKLNLPTGLDSFWSMMAQKENIIGQFLKPEYNNFGAAKTYIKQNHFSEPVFKDLTKEMMRVDTSTWLVDESLSMSDKLSMAWAVEQRVPILDKEVVELAMRVPTKYKINSAKQGKLIFKEALKDYLPDYVFNKPKTGWFSPVAKWLRTDLKDMAYEILSENYNSETKEMFDFVAIRKILDRHISGEEYALNTIWSLINFQIWFKIYKS